MDRPWRDKDTLAELYVGQGLSMAKTAKQLGCSRETVRKYLHRYNLPVRPKRRFEPVDYDEETLRTLYLDEGLSTIEIGERYDCAPRTVSKHLREYGIPARPAGGQNKVPWASYYMDSNGYMRWSSSADDNVVRVHRLLAVAEYGFDSVVDKSVHHKNKIPWDNRPDNIVPMDHGEHARMHQLQRYSQTE